MKESRSSRTRRCAFHRTKHKKNILSASHITQLNKELGIGKNGVF